MSSDKGARKKKTFHELWQVLLKVQVETARPGSGEKKMDQSSVEAASERKVGGGRK